MSRRLPVRSGNLRRALAQEAARVMEEHGIHDFRIAKRKAAERFGVTDGAVLPKNTEIEAALIEYQRLFGADSHERTLRELRGAACAAMRVLQRFSPRLVGPVLTGTATQHADVQLHLFAEDAEEVALWLMDRRIRYEVTARRVKMNAERVLEYPGVSFEIDGHAIEATVFPTDGIRQAPVSPVDGRPMRRADVSELEALLAAG
ncbi:MAG TPA: hypothetical protein VMB48_15455 [Steroidobacteraceae bacterium]|nr:hypothetical protein [Steroidobacteraceae bacterium]